MLPSEPTPPPAQSVTSIEEPSTSPTSDPSTHHAQVTWFLAPLRVSSFRLLFTGQLISSVGDVFYEVALPWFILTSGGTAQDLGLVLGAYGVPRIGTALLGGWLADRLQPRRVMLAADAARAVLVGILALLALGGHVVLWQLVLVALPLGLFAGLFAPAYLAVTPTLLPEETLQAGNSLNSVSLQLATLVAPGLAGILINRLRSAPALGIDAMSFVVSAVSLAIMRIPQSVQRHDVPPTDDDEKDLPRERAGTPPASFWSLLRMSRFLQALLLFPLLGNLTGGALEVALPALVKGPFEAGAAAYGVLLVGSGAGALLGALVAGSLSGLAHRGKVMLGCFMVQEVLIGLLPVIGSHAGMVAVVVLEIGAGVCNAMGNTFFLTILQLGTPRTLLGRVMGALLFTNYAFYPLSVILGGLMVSRFGPAVVFPTAAALVFAAIIVGWTLPAIRGA